MKKEPQNKKLLFYVTEDWYFCSHRLELAIAARKKGFDVVLVTRVRNHGDIIEKSGIRLIPFESERRSLNPFSLLNSVIRLIKIYRLENPDIIHHVALKPVVLGSLAARLSGHSEVVNALAGLGWLYSSKSVFASLLGKTVRFVLKIMISRGYIIVQNPDDKKWLLNLGAKEETIRLIKGSGVNIQEIYPRAPQKGLPVILLVSRMLWEKGIGDFVETASEISKNGKIARFVLVGDPDPSNLNSINEETLRNWNSSGIVEWWGRRNDMPEVLAQAHVACLPSFYGEGIPKSLLEALAAGLPVVTTDTPGCREVVIDGENGFLVPARDTEKLGEALLKTIENPGLRTKMGKKSRQLAEKEFSIEKVISQTLDLYSDIINNPE